MKINSYTKTDEYYEFIGDNGFKMLCPIGSVILVDDGATITIKRLFDRASRRNG